MEDLKPKPLERIDPLRVFIGFDKRQPIAFHVLAHSVWRTSHRPVSITQLNLDQLPMKRRGLTEFTYSRFLVPYLSQYKGYSLFLDSDMLCLSDVHELLAYAIAYPDNDVSVVQSTLNFEWPSLMLFNNVRCTHMTPEFVDNKNNPLFKFEWAKNIGSLPKEWNHLVGYDAPNKKAKLVHFTKGIPVWEETKGAEFADEWRKEFATLRSTVSHEALMGNSVHVQRASK